MRLQSLILTIFFSLTVLLFGSCTSSCGGIIVEYRKGDTLDLTNEKYSLVFEDNFEFYNSSVWNSCLYSNGLYCAGKYDNTVRTFFCRNGSLFIPVMKTTDASGESFYTACLVSSKNQYNDSKVDQFTGFSQTYGVYEIRCKLMSGYGIWGEFALLPETEGDLEGGSDGAQINVLQSKYYPYESNYESVRFSFSTDSDSYFKRSGKYYIPECFSEYHTFTLIWTEESYCFYIDYYKTWEIKRDKYISDVDEYMRLAVFVEGENDGKNITEYGSVSLGDPRYNDWTNPPYLEVDYVRVYDIIG